RRIVGDNHVVNGLRTLAAFDERELYLKFALALSLDILNCNFHKNLLRFQFNGSMLLFLGVRFLSFCTLGMWFPALGTFLGFTNDNIVTLGARDCAANEENVVGLAYLNDLEVLTGTLNLSHVTGHTHPAHDCARKQALANCA